MFSTVIGDMYRWQDAGVIARALTGLCSPFHDNAWAPSGVYMFWHPVERVSLYIGYSANLARRFCEHNALIPCAVEACKATD